MSSTLTRKSAEKPCSSSSSYHCDTSANGGPEKLSSPFHIVNKELDSVLLSGSIDGRVPSTLGSHKEEVTSSLLQKSLCCHPEHIRCTECKLREGSLSSGVEMLRCAQHDNGVALYSPSKEQTIYLVGHECPGKPDGDPIRKIIRLPSSK